ncbi:MAG: glucosaminidase domain-containing protein [Bacteroidales bacterium]|nr:glucosaminidase domain-containing protein [Bacteroidales bacterium]
MKHLLSIFILLITTSLFSQSEPYSFRKYANVESFYQLLTKEAIEVGVKNNVPPAALLAIAGLESGYGSGYVAQITGNILSLNAGKGDKKLPPLYLPTCGDKDVVLFDSTEIKSCPKKNLNWKQRPSSLKHDYRPAPYAGTIKNLAYLKHNPNQRILAQKACLNGFARRWLSKNNKNNVFRDASLWLDSLVNKEGTKALFSKEVNIKFISMIGGHPNSFNFREIWPKKVKRIMNKVGLVNLCSEMYEKKLSFEQAWKNNSIND